MYLWFSTKERRHKKKKKKTDSQTQPGATNMWSMSGLLDFGTEWKVVGFFSDRRKRDTAFRRWDTWEFWVVRFFYRARQGKDNECAFRVTATAAADDACVLPVFLGESIFRSFFDAVLHFESCATCAAGGKSRQDGSIECFSGPCEKDLPEESRRRKPFHSKLIDWGINLWAGNCIIYLKMCWGYVSSWYKVATRL